MTNISPPPLGMVILCDDRLFGLSGKYLDKKGINCFKEKYETISDMQKDTKLKVIF